MTTSTYLTYAVPLGLAGLTSVWRYSDGQGHEASMQHRWQWRWPHSNAYAAVLCLCAGLWAAWPLSSALPTAPIALATIVTFWLLTRGMPGIEYWLPHWSEHPKARKLYRLHRPISAWDLLGYGLAQHPKRWREGMLVGYFVPIFATFLCLMLWSQVTFGLVVYGLSGFLVASVYVIGSNRSSLPGPFTGEEWGRISMGLPVLGLALL
jgi:hypothetical protein